MKIATTILLLLATVAAFAQTTPTYFNPPTSNYMPMNIYVIEAAYNGNALQAGDEIGFFDHQSGVDVCVGAVKLTETFDPGDSPINVSCYKKDTDTPGFIEDDSIIVKIYDASLDSVFLLAAEELAFRDPATGDPIASPLYASLTSTAVEITGGFFSLQVDVKPSYGGTTTPAPGTYQYDVSSGEQVVISAEPEPGYELSYWTVDGVDYQSLAVSVTMDQNHQVRAVFKQVYAKLSILSYPSAGLTVPSISTSYQQDTWVQIIALPDTSNGYTFDYWDVEDDVQIKDMYNDTTEIFLDQDRTVTAYYKQENATLMFLIEPAGSGVTSPRADTEFEFTVGTTVSMVAVANEGWVFDHWDGAVTDPTNWESSVVLDSNKVITANFVRKTFTLNLGVNNTNYGYTLIRFSESDPWVTAENSYTLDYGTSVYLMAAPQDNEKHEFSAWTGDQGSTDITLDFVVDQNMDLTANFSEVKPVEFSAFSVSNQPGTMANAVLLKWETATETNNLGFEIERAYESAPEQYETIGFLDGAGTTSEPQTYSYTDNDANAAGLYYYRLKQIDTDGTYAYSDTREFTVEMPTEYSLKQNYPNPFNPSTEIVFQLIKETHVTITVYDILGREVTTLVDTELQAGTHRLNFDATTLSAGVYVYSMQAESYTAMKKMTLIK